MTTIAYDHKSKQIAYDGYITQGSEIVSTNFNKCVKARGCRWFMASENLDHVPLLISCDPGDSIEAKCCGIMVDSSGDVFVVYTDSENVVVHSPVDYNETLGSGADWAKAALDFGQTAKQAVQYASNKDIYTGGKIRVYSIK